MDFKNAMDSMVQEFERMVKKLLETAPYDKTYTGVVTAKEATRISNEYDYKIKVGYSIKKIKSSYQLEVGDYVRILVPNNKWNNAILVVSPEQYSQDINAILNRLDAIENRLQ